MNQYNLYEAKTHLSQLVQAALDGEEVCIARAGKPAVKLVPVDIAPPRTTGWGALTLDPEALDKGFEPAVDLAVANQLTGATES
jgi:prevent-host-death family protein